jgi:hypothetical protein
MHPLEFWHKLLFNDNRVIGGNKLRTYRKIKTDFKREQYLYADFDKNSLWNFIQIRVSNCNLNIEKGRKNSKLWKSFLVISCVQNLSLLKQTFWV